MEKVLAHFRARLLLGSEMTYGCGMSSEKQKTKNKKLPIILSIAGLLLVAGVVGGFVFQGKIKTVAADIAANIENRGKPKFIFDIAKFPDWATAGNVWTNTEDVAKGSVPITGISIAQCTPGSKCSNLVEKCRSGDQCEKLKQVTADGCSVHLDYWEQSIDPDTAVADKMKQDTSSGGMAVRGIGMKTLSMATPEGDKEYQLHQYDISHSGGDSYKRGNALGYVSLSNGHIKVQSVCDEANRLDETLPVLNAVRLTR